MSLRPPTPGARFPGLLAALGRGAATAPGPRTPDDLRADRDQKWRVAGVSAAMLVAVLFALLIGLYLQGRDTQRSIDVHAAQRQVQLEELARDGLSQHQQIVDATQCLVDPRHIPCRTEIVTVTVSSPSPYPVPTVIQVPFRVDVPTPVPTVIRVPTPVPTPFPSPCPIKLLCR